MFTPCLHQCFHFMPMLMHMFTPMFTPHDTGCCPTFKELDRFHGHGIVLCIVGCIVYGELFRVRAVPSKVVWRAADGIAARQL